MNCMEIEDRLLEVLRVTWQDAEVQILEYNTASVNQQYQPQYAIRTPKRIPPHLTTHPMRLGPRRASTLKLQDFMASSLKYEHMQ